METLSFLQVLNGPVHGGHGRDDFQRERRTGACLVLLLLVATTGRA